MVPRQYARPFTDECKRTGFFIVFLLGGENMLEIINVTKTYKQDQEAILHAVDNVTLHVGQGEIFGLIGLSGAGKSTLLRMIAGLETPEQGSIRIDGIDVSKLSKHENRRYYKNLGVVFQGYHLLYQKSVFDNIALPMRLFHYEEGEIQERVEELLQLVGLLEKRNNFPSQLSGGQKQRVAIARALALKPKLLLLDEITSALDPKTTLQILDLLEKIHATAQVTIVLITHEIAVASRFTKRIAVLNYGEIVEEGLTKDILENPQSDITKLLLGKEF